MKLKKINARGFSHLFRDEKGTIYFRKEQGKIKVFKSTKTDVLGEAKIEAERLWQEALNNSTSPSEAYRHSAGDLFRKWISRKLNVGKADTTITSIKSSGNHLLPFLDNMRLKDINSQWWEEQYVPKTKYLRFCQKRREIVESAKPRKFFNDRKWLKSFLLQMRDDGLLKPDEIPNFEKVDSSTKIGKAYSKEEVEDLLNFSYGTTHAAILMASTMGMRRKEIFHLEWSMVDFESGYIALPAWLTKTRKERSFKISEDCLKVLQKYRDNGSAFVFPGEDKSRPLHKDGFYNSWKTVKKLAGVKGRFHDLRHTFLTNAFKAKEGNPAFICDYAGLRLDTALKTYVHFTKEDTAIVASLVRYDFAQDESRETKSEKDNSIKA